MATTIKTAKSALRKSMKQRLASIAADSLAAQSQNVFKYVVEHPKYQSSKSVACYLSLPSGEIQTDSLVGKILADGKTLYVPKLIHTTSPSGAKDSFMNFYHMHSEEDLHDNLLAGVWGIREPRETYGTHVRETVFSQNSHGVDLILMPGMAFDRNLSRLGHGKGYYDRFIAQYKDTAASRGWDTPTLFGLGLQEQALEDGLIPMTNSDVPLDALVLSDGIVSRKHDE